MAVDYHEKYKVLKRKLKMLIYEHEGLTQELEKSQRKLLKVSRDNSFLLDRLLQYEQVVTGSPFNSDDTLSTDSDSDGLSQPKKRSVQASGSGKSIKSENTEIATVEKDDSAADTGQPDSKSDKPDTEIVEVQEMKEEAIPDDDNNIKKQFDMSPAASITTDNDTKGSDKEMEPNK
ncbi:uncharacterized protein LOC143446229 [Clavelina lepadiformis]|uniref:uncharacterized protein LOC143446229 n=1 Tax=Clavelina lepadiformis TaxID=159417 RepID=UPI00404215B9